MGGGGLEGDWEATACVYVGGVRRRGCGWGYEFEGGGLEAKWEATVYVHMWG